MSESSTLRTTIWTSLAAATCLLVGGATYGEVQGGPHILWGHWIGNGASILAMLSGLVIGFIVNRRPAERTTAKRSMSERTALRWVVTSILALVFYCTCFGGLYLWLNEFLPAREGGIQGILNALETLGHLVGRLPTLVWAPVLAAFWALPIGRILASPIERG